MTHLNSFAGLITLCVLSACGGGGDDGCRIHNNQFNEFCDLEFEIDIPDFIFRDGIWRGVDSGGRDVFAFVNRFGSFQFVDGFENQGSGGMAYSEEDVIDSDFQLVTQRGETFADGTTAADCTFSGTIIERQTITVTESCITSGGLQFQEQLILDFDTLYDRDSSLTTISGMYEMSASSVLSIASDGSIFVQDPESGCVINGQVRVTVTFSNMYFYDYDIDNCDGPDAIWNGSSFSGLAILDNTVSPEVLEYAVIGVVGGVQVSVVARNDRI